MHTTMQQNTGETIAWPAAFPSLMNIQDEAWLDAVRAAREMIIPAGTVVVREGDACRNFLLIAQGSVRVYKVAENGREMALYRTHSGDICILTLRNLLAQACYSADAVTESDVRAIHIPAHYFHAALNNSEAFRLFIMSTLAQRLNDMMQLVEQVAFQRLDLRLACLLGQLFGKQGNAMLQITHAELARELGTSRVVVSRLLKEFEGMGCIRLLRGSIELVSMITLERLGSGTGL